MGSDRVRQVAGRCASHCFKTELARACEGHGDDAIFKRQGWMVHRVVLNIKLVETKISAKIFGAYERSKPRVRSHEVRAFDRQQVEVAPHAARTILDLFTRNSLLDLVVVVLHLKRTEAHFADMDRLR